MEIFNGLVDFFQLGRIWDVQTFPELLGVVFESLFAIAIVVYFFKVVFYTCFRIGDLK